MTIGKLYNAQNVVVGQAACLLAPKRTPLPAMSAFNLADPFDLTPFANVTLTVSGATSFTITKNGQTTSSLTVSGLTIAAIRTALENLASVGVGNAYVSGAAPNWSISFAKSVPDGPLTTTPVGGTVTVSSELWTPVGATDQGWKFGANKSTNDVTIEEQAPSVRTTMGSQKITVEGALSEDIEDTLAVVYNMYQTLVAAITGTPGYTKLTLTDDILTYALAMPMANVKGYPRILYIPEVVSLSNAETTLRRAAAKRMYPAVFSSQCATEEIVIYNITAPALP